MLTPLGMRNMLGRSALLLSVLSIAACSAAPQDDASSSEDAISDVPHTPVKEQTIGNCWLYASVGWAEALHRSAANETVDLSESYLTYWHWYDQIATASPTTAKVETGGFFREATKLMRTYGLVSEAKFIPGDEARPASSRQKLALTRINAALAPKSDTNTDTFAGRLAKAEQRVPKTIRAVLNDAYELPADVRADLDTTFGKDAPTALTEDRAVPARFISPFTFEVTSKASGTAPVISTLAAVIPQWEEVYLYGDEARAPLRRMQKALHDSLPVLVTWNVDHASGVGDGTFRKRPTSKLDKWDGAHMTVVEDYQATNVPSFGTLAAGVTVTDPAALNAALSDQSKVAFLRIKNSWGFRASPSGSEDLKGYYDLYADYLFGMRALTSVIIPTGYDATAPVAPADACGLGGKKRTGTYCVKGITSDASDKRLVVCQAGVTTTGRTCEQGCAEQAAGVPDACVDGGGTPAPPPPNPCKTGGARSSGKYCGASLRLPSSDPGHARLYSCQKDLATGEWLSPSVACARGCAVQPSGTPDVCR